MANYITILRMVLILPVLYFFIPESSLYNWLALVFFVIAGVTDHLDGYIARKTGSTSSLGALLDLVADKLLIIITISYLISYSSNILLIIPSLIIVFREIVISSFRQLLAEQKGSNTVKVSFLAKTKTTLQIFALSFLIISPNFGQIFYSFTILLFWISAYVSLQSLYEYIKTYRIFIK